MNVGHWDTITVGEQQYLAWFSVSEEPRQQLTFVAQVYLEPPEMQTHDAAGAPRFQMVNGVLDGPDFGTLVLEARKNCRFITGRSYSSLQGAIDDAVRQLEIGEDA